MNRAVILETEHLVLRPFRPDDAEALFRCLGDPALLEFKPFHPYSSTQCAEIARKRSEDNSYRAICLKGHNRHRNGDNRHHYCDRSRS